MSMAPVRFATYLVLAFVVFSTITLLPGAFRVSGHEIDLIHSLDIAYRMADGLVPHVDFMTPLGALAFEPISRFLDAGFGPGRAYLLSNIAVTGLLLPGTWWVGMSRLEGRVRTAFGVAMVILGLAMVFGGPGAAITASMYYNRWAWIPASWVTLLLILPPRAGWRSPLIDGLVLGFAGGVLVLVKVTYVIALLPFALHAVFGGRQWRLLAWALASAIAVLVWATFTYGGPALWPAYVNDLLAVATESQRTSPGLELSDLVASASTLTMTLMLLLVIVFWRRSRMKSAGLAMFLLAPGWVYITYQNWGNDPKWLFLLSVILLTRLPPAEARPFWGVEGRAFSKILAVVCLVLFMPSMLTLASSSVRHAGKSGETTIPLLADLSKADIELEADRAFTGLISQPFDAITTPDRYEDPEAEEPEPLIVNGETLAKCSLTGGFVGWIKLAAEQLSAVEEAVGRHVLVADVYDQLWMFGPFARNDRMAPWYYGTDTGFDEIEYVLVPLCPVSTESRRQKMDQIADFDWTLEEVIRTDLFILLRRES